MFQQTTAHASDIEIECNMKEIKDWERELSSIRKEAREVVRLVNGNNLTDLQEGTRKLVQDLKMLETNVDSNISCLKKMDEVRNLFTLGARKIDKVKLPQFSGKPHEAFIVFKTKMIKLRSLEKILKIHP